MLEVLIVVCIFQAIQLMPLRGKTFEGLTLKQQQKVEKNLQNYKKTLKGRKTPEMTVEEYMPIIQKQALNSVIAVVVLVPIYLVILVSIYPTMMG